MPPPPDQSSIPLATAKGTPIENYQIGEISHFERNQFQLFDRWASGRVERGDPTGRYNCHGMSFAARRTGIYERQVVERILAEDGYREVSATGVLPGDVIVYLSPEGDAEHSGQVVDPPHGTLLGVARVISKWGKYCEFIHWANQCPYDYSNVKYFRVIVKDAAGSSE